MAIWSRLTGAIAGIGVGGAAATAFEPAFEVPRQVAWEGEPNRVLDLGTLAHLISQGLLDEAAAENEAARNGYNPNRLRALVQLNLKAPDVAEALALWRRGRITEAQVDHALAKSQLEEQYHAAVKELEFARLDPAIIATAIQRGIMHNPGFLPVGPPTAEGKVRAFPVSPLDPVQEAFAAGVNEDRLFVETAIVGLPLSLQQAASAYFRGIIERVDFDRAVSEGNTRNEWGPAALEQARQILTAGEYAELELRGFLTTAERHAKTALHGMSEEDSNLLYDVLGRAIPEHAILTGEARGGVYNGPIDHIPEAFLSALRRGNIRPEYYNLAYANRYSYPSAFVLRSLTQAGDISQLEAHQILLNIGWTPELAATVSQHWAGGTTTAVADPYVKKAQTQLWSQTHKSYVEHEIAEAAASAALDTLGVTAAAQTDVFRLWNAERSLVRRELSPKEVAKAWAKDVLNPATGVAWTRDEAKARLLEMGYTADDAETLLGEQ